MSISRGEVIVCSSFEAVLEVQKVSLSGLVAADDAGFKGFVEDGVFVGSDDCI